MKYKGHFAISEINIYYRMARKKNKKKTISLVPSSSNVGCVGSPVITRLNKQVHTEKIKFD